MAKRVAKKNKWGTSTRFYQVGEKQFPSVTSILSCIGKPALVAWSAKVEREMCLAAAADLYTEVGFGLNRETYFDTLRDRVGKTKASQKLLEKAGAIGTEAHELIEWTIKSELKYDVGPRPIISAPALVAVGAWEHWKSRVKFEPVLCEHAVWSHKYQIAGTMDLLARIDGRMTLLDWKTGKSIYREAHLQNAAYRVCLHEMGLLDDLNCDGLIIRLPKTAIDPDFEVGAVTDPLDHLFGVFLHVKALWDWTMEEEVLTTVETEPELSGTNRVTQTEEL